MNCLTLLIKKHKISQIIYIIKLFAYKFEVYYENTFHSISYYLCIKFKINGNFWHKNKKKCLLYDNYFILFSSLMFKSRSVFHCCVRWPITPSLTHTYSVTPSHVITESIMLSYYSYYIHIENGQNPFTMLIEHDNLC